MFLCFNTHQFNYSVVHNLIHKVNKHVVLRMRLDSMALRMLLSATGLEVSLLKPGSHMPTTYLGHNRRHSLGQHCGICKHLSLTHNLPQALTAGDCQRWKYFMWTLSADATYSRKTIWSIFTGIMVDNCAIRFAFWANLSMLAIHRSQMQQEPTGTDRQMLLVATGDNIGRIWEPGLKELLFQQFYKWLLT